MVVQGLPYAADQNPISENFVPMRLHRKCDVRQRAILHHGSVDTMQSKMRPWTRHTKP